MLLHASHRTQKHTGIETVHEFLPVIHFYQERRQCSSAELKSLLAACIIPRPARAESQTQQKQEDNFLSLLLWNLVNETFPPPNETKDSICPPQRIRGKIKMDSFTCKPLITTPRSGRSQNASEAVLKYGGIGMRKDSPFSQPVSRTAAGPASRTPDKMPVGAQGMSPTAWLGTDWGPPWSAGMPIPLLQPCKDSQPT